MITSSVSSIAYNGNASTSTAYAIPYPYIDEDDIIVTSTDSSGTVLTLSASEYSITSITDSNGRNTSGELVTTTAYASTYTITIKRSTEGVQPLDLTEGGQLQPESVELALDRAVMQSTEAKRDAINGGDSNITATGTGIVAQTAADAFATRTITPAANSGLSITNGDGVAGNPTIDLDETGLTVITTVADTDKIRVETSSGSEVIEVSDLLDRSWPTYKVEEIPLTLFSASGGATGVTAGDEEIQFTTTSTVGALGSFVIPEDYSGGDISVKVHAYVFGGSPGDPFVMELAAYNNTGDSIGSIVASVIEQEMTHSDTDCRSSAFNLGDSFVAGNHYYLTVNRDTAHASDTATGIVYVRAIRFQYQATRVTSSW